MLPGPDRVIACPSCKSLETHLTLHSFTEWDVYRWTDGFRLCYSHPEPPPVAKCGHCGYVYWLRDAKAIGKLHDRRGTTVPPEWQRAEHVVEPSEAEYYEALEPGLEGTARKGRIAQVLAWRKSNEPIGSGLGRTAEKERIARVLAWWKSNEPLRGGTLTQIYSYWNSSPVRRDELPKVKREIGPWNPDPGARQANMERLLALLDLREANDRILRVEVLRQLGRFDEALAALQDVGFEQASWVLDQIRTLCEEGDTLVRLLDDPGRQNLLDDFERPLQ
jgi:hypothetical protein